MEKKGKYSMMESTLPTNLTMQWNNLTVGSKFNSSTICQGDDFLSNFVFKPAVEESLRKFLRSCLQEPDTFIQDDWKLCRDDGNFSCNSIKQYARSCGGRITPQTSATTEECTLGHMMQEDAGTPILLIGLVFMGILVGVAGTIAVCLICPGAHRWAMRKLREDKSSKEDAVRASTVSSGYYAAIEENRNVNMIRLQPVEKLPSIQNEQFLQFSQNDNGISTLGSPVGHANFNDPVYQQNGISEEPVYSDTTNSGVIDYNYEGLDRSDFHSQSHKYEQINSRSMDSTSPQSIDSEGHGYFTLEKIT